MPCRDRMWLRRMTRWCRDVAPAFLVSVLLTGCATPDCPRVATLDYSQYEPCLPRNETVKGASQVGAFTVLDVYRSPAPLPFNSGSNFQRILYQGHTVVDETAYVHAWAGKEVLFARTAWGKAGKAQYHLVYARDGKPVVEDIGDPSQTYNATTEFPYGYPLTPDLRYFGHFNLPDSRGYLLGVHPTRVVTLPMTPTGVRTPLLTWLAGVSPDGKTFAYIDDYDAVSAIRVVDADGASRGVVPIPMTPLAKPDAGQHPFAPAWRWFGATYRWDKNEHGAWIVARRGTDADASAPPQNPLEELFIDARVGYRQCFAQGDPACLRGWGPRTARADLAAECCLSRYAWAPTIPARAFGANVTALFYADQRGVGSGYEVMLDAPHDSVTAAIVRGLRSRKIPFVRLDDCPAYPDGAKECLGRMERTVGWKTPVDDGPVRQMLRLAQERAVFMTPTAAFVVFPMEDGSSLLTTLARHDLTAPAGARTSAR